MHPTPATVASVLLLFAALALVVLTAVMVRPQRPAVTTQAAPGPQAREHGREPRARRTPRRGAEARTARPAARSFVLAYYRSLDARRYEKAWAALSPAVRTAFGGFAAWSGGYASTRSSTPRAVRVQREGGSASVAHELVAEDRSPCGLVRRVFAVRWRLEPAGGAWRAAHLSASKLSGPEPAEACGARHDAAGVAGGS